MHITNPNLAELYFSRTATRLMVVGLAAVTTASGTQELPSVRTAVCEFIGRPLTAGAVGGNNRDLRGPLTI